MAVMVDIKVGGLPLKIEGNKHGLRLTDRQTYRGVDLAPKTLDCLISALMKAKRELGMAPTRHTEEQKRQVFFKCLNPGCPPLKYRAWVKDAPAFFGEGKTEREAFGDLAQRRPELFNVEFVYTHSLTPPPARPQEAASAVTPPPLPLLPQKGMMVQFHECLYRGTPNTVPVAALVVGETPLGLTLKLFRAAGNESIVRDVPRGGQGKPGTWEFIPCKFDETQQADDFTVKPAEAQKTTDGFGAWPVNKGNAGMTMRAKMIHDLRAQGQGDYADRIEQIDGPDAPKLLAFPCDDVTCEVDFDGVFYISDHEELVAMEEEDVPAVIESLQRLLAAHKGTV